ncbi:MAG: aspartate aminotransferase family protein [Fidelibacterota bacterium]
MSTATKDQVLKDFRSYVSPDRVDFFKKYGLDFVMGKRNGCYLWDMDGKKKLFDSHCNGGVFNLGHRNGEVIEALRGALEEVDVGNHHLLSSYRAALAKRLAESMPGDIGQTVFSVGGGEAVDVAIKLVRGYTGRAKIVSAKGGYHGHTGLALAAGDEHYRKPFGPMPPGFVQIPFGDLDAVKGELDEDTAGIILETVPATLGIVVAPAEYLAGVRRLCDERGAQLILDEVQTGLGRTGKVWGFQHYRVVPDVVVVGKGLSGGIYPIAATCYRPHLQAVFREDPFIHISTFGGAELGCAVGLKVVEMTSQPEFLKHVVELGKEFEDRVATLMEERANFIVEFRQLGLMMGIKMKNELCGPLLTKTAFDSGLLIIYANHDKSVCQLTPPLITSFDQLDEVMGKLETAVSKASQLLPILKVKEGVSSLWRRIKSPLSSPG